MRETHTAGRLSSEQVAAFRQEGYLIYPDPVFCEAEFEALDSHFERKLTVLPPDFRPEAMDKPHFVDTQLFRWLFSDSVLDLVEPILGPDIALFSSHFICKPKGDGKKVPWHEDSYYWRGMLNPMEAVTVWLAVDSSTAANGAMRVIPRALHGFSEYDPVDDPSRNVFQTEIKKAMRDESKAVTLELEPNHASLHDGRLMHGSAANTSNLRRCGYTMRYISTRTKLFHPPHRGNDTHQIYLARGKDHVGNNYADPTVTYSELARYCEQSPQNGH